MLAAGDGEAALDCLRQEAETFDPILLNVTLPGRDGVSVRGETRADDAGSASNYGRALIDGGPLPLPQPRSNGPCLAEFLASEHRIVDRDGELITGPVEDLSE